MKAQSRNESLSILSRRLSFLAGELPQFLRGAGGGVTTCANQKPLNICNKKPSKFRPLLPLCPSCYRLLQEYRGVVRRLWRCIFLLVVQVELREKEKENVLVSGLEVSSSCSYIENKQVDYVRSIFNGCVREHVGIFWTMSN